MGAAAYKTLRENIVEEIRTKILSHELAPGTRIIEKRLADEFGTSRAPIREALRQLEQEGLVEYARNSGCSVKKITIADVYEVYTMQALYEMSAVKLCNGSFSEEEFMQMEQTLMSMKALREDDIAGVVACDRDLHSIIIRKTKMPRLIKAWNDLHYGNNMASINSGSYKSGLAKRQYIIHRGLVDIFHAGKAEDICRAVYEHYMSPVKQVMIEEGLPIGDFYFLYGI